jgi:two-component system, OmpR family, phosphate regulon sensor histidine kinase PhoR
MTRNTIRLVIVLATLIFIGLVSTQIVWVKKAYTITEEQLNHEIEVALTKVVEEIRMHGGDSSFIVDPIKEVSPNFYRVQISEQLQPYYLESVLKTEFLNSELNYDFQYSIYNCFNDSVIFTKAVTNEDDASESEPKAAPNVEWQDDGHYFSVFFPTLNYEVVSEMRFWIASSIMLLIVLIFFAFVINIILKQKRMSEIKNDFINNMTHELKTPISTIALSSDVLLKSGIENQPDRIKAYAQIIKSENQRLQTQVERVLQIARLDKEEIDLKKTTFNLHEAIELAVPSIEMNFADQGITIDCDLKANQHEIEGDEMHITNILFNLLDNAAKYGGDPPKISIKTKSQSKGVTISITDNGPGISGEHQKQVFERFYRIPTGNVHDVKGFGLGLHYVKTITEAHNGKVKIKSKLGQGSTFEVFLPYGTEFVK